MPSKTVDTRCPWGFAEAAAPTKKRCRQRARAVGTIASACGAVVQSGSSGPPLASLRHVLECRLNAGAAIRQFRRAAARMLNAAQTTKSSVAPFEQRQAQQHHDPFCSSWRRNNVTTVGPRDRSSERQTETEARSVRDLLSRSEEGLKNLLTKLDRDGLTAVRNAQRQAVSGLRKSNVDPRAVTVFDRVVE